MAPFREPRHCPYSPDLVESGTMLRFAASRLCGRARDGCLAVIVLVSPPLGRFHRGAGLFVTACPENRWLVEALTSSGPPDGSARLGRTEEAPVEGECRGFRTGDPPG